MLQTLACWRAVLWLGGADRGLSHLRFAVGVCVLAAGLLMGGAGGAVAVADPDSSGSATRKQRRTSPTAIHRRGKPEKPAPTTSKNRRHHLEETGATTPLKNRRHHPKTGSRHPKNRRQN